ncbi:MAG: hypothetical protein V7K26_27905 [Nostoc sp.]
MSENNNPQPKTDKPQQPQPPNTIGRPHKTELINSKQQPTKP